MITSVSPCANVFDETLHAVNYSAIGSQVMVGPSAPPSLKFTSIPAKCKASLLGKHEASAAAGRKKRKTCDDKIHKEGEEEASSSDEDAPESWKVKRDKLLSAVQMLRNALAEEQKSKHAVRAEVCEELEKQLTCMENEYQESIRRQKEIVEEKYERKMEIYMEAVQNECKCQRRADDGDDYVASVDLRAAEVKLSNYAHEVSQLKNNNTEMSRELASAQENIGKLTAKRDQVAEKRTKSELLATKQQQTVEFVDSNSTAENEMLDELWPAFCQIQKKYSTHHSSLESLETGFNVAEHTHQAAEDDISGHLSSVVSHEAELKRVKEELNFKEAELQKCSDREQQLSSSLNMEKQKFAEIEGKLQTAQNELWDKKKRLQELDQLTANYGSQSCKCNFNDDIRQKKTKIEELEKEVEKMKTSHDYLKINERELNMKLEVAERNFRADTTRTRKV